MIVDEHGRKVHFLEEIHGEILKKFHSKKTKCFYVEVENGKHKLRTIDGISFNYLIAYFKKKVYHNLKTRELQIEKLGETIKYQKGIIRDRQRKIEEMQDVIFKQHNILKFYRESSRFGVIKIGGSKARDLLNNELVKKYTKETKDEK